MPFFQLRALVASLVEAEDGAVEARADDGATEPTIAAVDPSIEPSAAMLDGVLTSLSRR